MKSSTGPHAIIAFILNNRFEKARHKCLHAFIHRFLFCTMKVKMNLSLQLFLRTCFTDHHFRHCILS